MKNKFKKVIAASLAVSVLLAFTGCGNNQAPSADNKKQESASTADTASMDEQSKKRDDLYQQENQIFADHKDAWDKVFGLMNKNSAGESLSENYADLLAGTVESNKDSFTEEEYDTLCKDIETIRGIEEELAAIEKEIAEDAGSQQRNVLCAVFPVCGRGTLFLPRVRCGGYCGMYHPADFPAGNVLCMLARQQ